jgi:hypothetical protein
VQPFAPSAIKNSNKTLALNRSSRTDFDINHTPISD